MKKLIIYCMCIMQVLFLGACINTNLTNEQFAKITYNDIKDRINSNTLLKKDSLIIEECQVLDGNDEEIWLDKKQKRPGAYIYYKYSAELLRGGYVNDQIAYCCNKKGEIILGLEYSVYEEKKYERTASEIEYLTWTNTLIGTATYFSNWTEFTQEALDDLQ